MSFFSDFKSALQSYITDSVSLDIVNVEAPGSIINVNEVCTFQARVANNGSLKMNGVTLEIKGLNGALVGTSPAGPWQPTLTVNGISVPSGGQRDTATLYFKAPGVHKPAFTSLVNVHVKEWDASLEPLLNRDTTGVEKFGHYQTEVHPS